MGKPTLGAGILRTVEMANELLSDEKIQEAADEYAPVWQIDGKQLSKVEILQRQHARLRSIAMAQVVHLKAMGYKPPIQKVVAIIGKRSGKTVESSIQLAEAQGYVQFDREKVAEWFYKLYVEAFGDFRRDCTLTKQGYLDRADQLKEILTGGKDEKV